MVLRVQPSSRTPAILPAEIWMHIAQFVPDTDLRCMLSINRVFFELAMDAKYHHLQLTFQADPESDAVALRRLQRVRDRSIGHRVHSLYVTLMDRGGLLYESVEEGNSEPEPNISMLEGIQTMALTAPYLTNVTEFSVDLFDCPREHLIPFFTVAWKSFGSGLRSLSFSILLEYLDPLLSTVDGLLFLRDLDVEIREQCFSNTDEEVLTTVLAPFVNRVAPTLHSLSLSISGLDVTPLFHNLEKVPNLEQLCIRVNHLETLMEPFGVTRFIFKHAPTLRHLDWDQLYQTSGEQYLMNLLRATKLEEVFLNLHTLRIRIPQSPGGVAVVAQHIRCSAQTLISLGLLGYDMTYEEVNTVISIFTPHWSMNLKELSIRVQFLSPELILLLAQTLPILEKVTIHMQHVTGHEAGKRTPEAIEADSNENRAREECANAVAFARTMRTYDIGSWALRDVGIRADAFDFHLSEKLMHLLAECIPSVQKFHGQDKEFYCSFGGTDERL